MPDVVVDVSDTDGGFEVENPHGFDLRITGCGLTLDVLHEQARSIYDALRPFFDDDQDNPEPPR
jgi:hypothetical protein